METFKPLREDTPECFREALGSGRFGECLAASLAAPTIGIPALAIAEELLAESTSAELTRMWALFTAQRFGAQASGRVQAMALSALPDSSPSVRCAALGVLGSLKAPESIPAILPLLSDTAQDPHAWWDPLTVGGAAREALRAIGTPEALEALGAA